MYRDRFILLFLAKKILILFTGKNIVGFYIDGSSNKMFNVNPVWYLMAIDAKEKAPLN